MKRRPGRPRGSAPFQAADEALLRQAADALIRQDASNLTAFLRDHDVVQDKDLARLRRRWREIGEALLTEAAASDTARVRDYFNLVISDIDRITNQAETWRSWRRFLSKVRADLATGATDPLSNSLACIAQDCFENSGLSMGMGDNQTRESPPEDPVHTAGRSTGDLLFLGARLLDQHAIEAWNQEGGLVDDHETAPD